MQDFCSKMGPCACFQISLCGWMYICVKTSFHGCVHAVESVHRQLFVAGLSPREPILLLSVPHSRDQPSPNFTLNLPAADPVSRADPRPCDPRASLMQSPWFLTYALCFLFLVPADILWIKIYHCSPYALSHTQAPSLSHLHTLICSFTRIDSREGSFKPNGKTLLGIRPISSVVSHRNFCVCWHDWCDEKLEK